MNKLFTCTLLLCVWWSQANEYDAAAQTRNFITDVKEDGSYQYQYDTTNGIAAQESGVGGYYVSGSSAYYAPDGQLITLSYTADENGFHPSGDHLPTSPPIPVAILKSLEYIRTHPRPQPQEDIKSDDIKYDIQTKLQQQKQQQQQQQQQLLQKKYIRNRQ